MSSTNGHHGPCLDGWPVDQACCSDIPAAADRDADEEALYQRVRAIAVETLWRASGRRYGICEITVRPCRASCGDGDTYEHARALQYGGGRGSLQPYILDGSWRNCGSSCGDCGDCRCCDAGCREIPLPGTAQEITRVRINGLALDPSEYRVDDHRMLVRQGGVRSFDTWRDIGAGRYVAVGSDLPQFGITVAGVDGVDGGDLRADPVGNTDSNGPFGRLQVQFSLRRPQERVRIRLAPGAILTLDTGWTVVDIAPLNGPTTVFVVDGTDPVEVRGGSAGGWVLTEGDRTQSPVFEVREAPVFVESVGYAAPASAGAAVPCWPTCQDMSLPDGADGTWDVTYTYGVPVGPMGQYALGTYMCELWKLCTGAKCRLPSNVEGVFRQGINIDFQDANLDLLSRGRLGIPEVDLWLAAVNPDGLHSASTVYSPDIRKPRSTTWP